MMRNNLLKIAAVLGLVGAVGTASAATTTLNGLAAGGLYFNYYGIEQVNQYNNIGGTGNEGNWGLIQVSSIYNGQTLNPGQTIGTGSNVLWSNGAGNGQIVGIFYGISFTSNPTHQVATGGQLDLYWLPHATATTFNVYNQVPSSRTAPNQFNGVTNALDVQLLMSASFSTGSVAYTGAGTAAGWDTGTVYSTTDPMVNTGAASSYLSVIPNAGAWSSTLGSNWFTKNANGQSLTGNVVYQPPFGPPTNSGMSYAGGAQDAYTSNSYQMLSAASPWMDYTYWSAGFNISSGSVTSYINSPTPTVAFDTVPEPGTVSAIGAGLVALAFGRRRIRRVH